MPRVQGKGAAARARTEGSGRAEQTEENANAPGRQNVPSIPPRSGTGESERRGDADATGDTANGEGESGDVPGYVPTPEDLRLREVYGDWVHRNPCTHLDGGVKDDSAWQAWWHDLSVMPSRRYDAPSGKVGRRFIGMLGVEMQGVRDRQWNLEWFFVFQTVILQRARHVTASHAIRRQIAKQLDAWGKGKHAMLVGDTLRSCEEYLTVAWREETAEH